MKLWCSESLSEVRRFSSKTASRRSRGLATAREIVDGLRYHDYASATALMAGAVFGRIAGRSAAAGAKGC
jgi:hypothetical protein